MINQMEFFTKIIEEYSKVKDNPLERELLKSNAIRELMEICSNNGNQEFIKEAMPILLSLFNEKCVDPYDMCSKDIEQLNTQDKQELNKILKKI